MPSDPKLTNAEVCLKYGIHVTDKAFGLARVLSDHRIDRTVCEVPECKCPHCGHEFTATFYDLGSNDPDNGDELFCPGCERAIYIEHIAEPEDGDPEGPVFVTLNTDPEQGPKT